MPAKTTILVDLNIMLDVLQKRDPFYETSAKLLALIETGKVRGLIASHSITTLFYLFQKHQSSAEARATITNLLQFMEVAAVDQSTIEQALTLDYQDYEDAVQMIAAVQNKADYLITRNIKDYKPPLLPVIQPVEFLAVFHSSEQD